ncbi:MAG TPA: vWA domain-containing protein [Thermoanaerobaculia bacterium]|nr:vWA domain-containing protein [Thermoanaerobaculia bacterium]
MRIRSRYFFLSGGLGGLAGFALTELLPAGGGATAGRGGTLAQVTLYFAIFGLAVGAALGMTEGLVRRNRPRLLLGAALGLILGGLGGALGGAVGQWLYGLAPERYALRSTADFPLVLDSSGSMKEAFFFGNDPWGRRRDAARDLIDGLASTNRVAVVDFDEQGSLLFPLTELATSSDRQAARAAVGRVDDSGGTDLTAGLSVGLGELARSWDPVRPQHLIFLTDGDAAYDPRLAEQARQAGVKVHTVGLGSGVKGDLLAGIATATGGTYYPVARASALVATFRQILERSTSMVQHGQGTASTDTEPLTKPWLRYALRVLSWAVMGLLLGLGQGVPYNTREDLRACGLGGLLGGALGGLLFDPITQHVALGAGLAGRTLADVAVGASIGGSLRLSQQKIVEASGKPTRQLVTFLPASDRRLVQVPSQPQPQPPPARPEAPPAAPERPLLSSFSQKYPDQAQAMARAYREGGYGLSEIAKAFGVSIAAVRRAVDEKR